MGRCSSLVTSVTSGLLELKMQVAAMLMSRIRNASVIMDQAVFTKERHPSTLIKEQWRHINSSICLLGFPGCFGARREAGPSQLIR